MKATEMIIKLTELIRINGDTEVLIFTDGELYPSLQVNRGLDDINNPIEISFRME